MNSVPLSLTMQAGFDPSNYAQNVLTTARSLQQITNQIPSLQNQAQQNTVGGLQDAMCVQAGVVGNFNREH